MPDARVWTAIYPYQTPRVSTLTAEIRKRYKRDSGHLHPFIISFSNSHPQQPFLQQQDLQHLSSHSLTPNNMLSNTVALFSTFVLALASVASAAPAPTDKTVTIEQVDDRFCLLLPPKCGLDIADNVHRGITYCTTFTPTVDYERILPDNFITSRHYATGGSGDTKYIQVTGRIDRDQFDLDSDDHGGQNDPLHPTGAKCAGYPWFVQLVEPDVQHFCLRCCMRKSDCPTDKSDQGCTKVVPGEYS